MEIFKHTNFDFLGKKWPFIGLSLALTLVGVISLVVKGGPRYGIDFTGGALIDIGFLHRPPAQDIRAAVRKSVSGEIQVQEVSGTQEALIQTGLQDERALSGFRASVVSALNNAFNPNTGKLDLNSATSTDLADRIREPLARSGASLSEDQLQKVAQAITDYRDKEHSGLISRVDELSSVPGVTPKVLNVLRQETVPGNFSVRTVEVVGPRIGADLRQQALWVVLAALGAMLIYIALRFEWIYGVAAVIAVFHDTIITIGLLSIFNKKIDLTVIAALLTLVGYSMNDTIVTFDRIRENLRLQRRGTFPEIVNGSINQTLSRTVLTSGLTLLTALSLLIFGGQVLNGFSFALVVGIIVGTYSSIFVASPILVFWRDFAEQRKRKGSAAGPAVRATTVTEPRKTGRKDVARPVR
jgi:preprotein translocase subunit SecF